MFGQLTVRIPKLKFFRKMKTTHFHGKSVRSNLASNSASKYLKPVLNHLGKIKDLTLKTGSTSDFGGNKYTP